RLDQQMKLLLAEMRLVFHRMSEVRAFHEPYLDRNDAICGLLKAGDRPRARRKRRLCRGPGAGRPPRGGGRGPPLPRRRRVADPRGLRPPLAQPWRPVIVGWARMWPEMAA